MIDQQAHVFVESAPAIELVGEAAYRHVGDSEQAVEADAVGGKFVVIPRFELGLRWRQRRANGIVDEIEHEAAAGVAVGVEDAQGREAFFENTAATLLFDVLGGVAGELANQVYAVVAIEGGKKIHRGFEQHGKVAADDDVAV